MLSKNDVVQRDQLEMAALDQLVPQDHLVRKIGIRSMRQTIAEVETNLAYRWFLGYVFYDKVPHFFLWKEL